MIICFQIDHHFFKTIALLSVYLIHFIQNLRQEYPREITSDVHQISQLALRCSRRLVNCYTVTVYRANFFGESQTSH